MGRMHPPGLIRFWPNSMLTRLPSRTGAKVRIPTAKASCAETAALIGAWSLRARLMHKTIRQGDDFAPYAGIPRPDHVAPGGVVRGQRCARPVAPVLIEDLIVDGRRVDAARRAVAYQVGEPVSLAII